MVEGEGENKLFVYEFAKDFSTVKVKSEYNEKAGSYTADSSTIDKANYENAQLKYFDKSNAIFQISRTDNWYLDACFNEVFI